MPRLVSDGSAGWFDELEEIVTTEPDGDELVLEPKKVAALARFNNEAVSDSDPLFVSLGCCLCAADAMRAWSASSSTRTQAASGLSGFTPWQ